MAFSAEASLHAFVGCNSFFEPCPAHAGAPARDAALNYFDVGRGASLCSLCVAAQPLSPVLQASGNAAGLGRNVARLATT